MDPLSIAAGVVPLLEVAAFITKSLYKLVKTHRTAESRIAGLCQELSSLTTFLQAVDKASRQFGQGQGAVDSALIEHDLRREIDQALINCELTLGELSRLVQKISERRKGFAWKSRTALDLSMYETELADHRDKIHKSNWALQTILSTINVSLSLRSNRSQTQILFELGKLKSSIDEALRISTRPVGGFSRHFGPLSDRLDGNLFHLAEAARTFHSAATSTAGTVRADESSRMSVRGRWLGQGSIDGYFPAVKRERVEQFLFHGGVPERQSSPPPMSIRSDPRTPYVTPIPTRLDENVSRPAGPQVDAIATARDPAPSDPIPIVDDSAAFDSDDDDADLERDYRAGLLDLAIESVRSLELEKAIPLLIEVLDDAGPSTPLRSLHIQLAACYFLTQRWQMAETIVTELAANKADRDIIICELLHALAIAQLTHDKSDLALKTCQQALQGKKKLCKGQDDPMLLASYHNTLGLLHIICLTCGNSNRAEVFRRKIPVGFEYEHCDTAQVYIARSQTVVRALFLLEDDDLVSNRMLDWVSEFASETTDDSQDDADANPPSPQLIGSAVANNDADDEASPISPQAVKNGFARILGRMMHRRTSREALDVATEPTTRTAPGLARQPAPTRQRQAPRPAPRDPTKAKTLLKKKRPQVAPQSMTTDDNSSDKNGTDVKSWIQSRLKVSRERKGGFDENWVTADEHARRYAERSRPPAHPATSEAMDTQVYEMADTSVAELADTSLDPKSIIKKYSIPERPPACQIIRTRVTPVRARQRPKTTPAVLPNKLHTTLSLVARALASIPTAKDADRLHGLRLDLELLSQDLQDSNDPTLLRDIAAAIASLQGPAISKQAESPAEDSGYESSQSTDRDADGNPKPAPPAQKLSFQQVHATQKYLNDTIKALSWSKAIEQAAGGSLGGMSSRGTRFPALIYSDREDIQVDRGEPKGTSETRLEVDEPGNNPARDDPSDTSGRSASKRAQKYATQIARSVERYQQEACKPQDLQAEDLVTYRPADYHGMKFLTGYSPKPLLSPESNADDETTSLDKSPRELILMIMERLGPADLYLMRQTSTLFYPCFSDAAFCEWRKPLQSIPTQTLCSDLSTGKPSLRHLTSEEALGAEEKLRAWQLIEFDHQKLLPAEKDHIRDILNRKIFCLDCTTHERCNWRIEDPDPQWRRCVLCFKSHKKLHFAQNEKQEELFACPVFDSRKKICPHHSISLFETRDIDRHPGFSTAQVFSCSACASSFCSGPFERPPTLLLETRSLEDCSFALDWSIKVCDLTEGQVVSKAFLRRNLEKLADEFLCSHAAWNREILLRPFHWDCCVCFSTSTAADGRTLRHPSPESCLAKSCCLYHDLRGSNWGKFMNADCQHAAECSRCSSKYVWERRGREVFLSRHESWPDMWQMEFILGEVEVQHQHRDQWVVQVDVGRIRAGAKYGHPPCSHKGCPNSRSLWWTNSDSQKPAIRRYIDSPMIIMSRFGVR
ncbi:hypothetical protein CMUS01_14694 [Colletotrichum musicola]|uniref:Azaphilone pigments biosynthesis cluster protein L N-terminal domain-containing protein n=1 Tax=Colletotrichum musicola TaxID=2175873 RepID=A0A8H6J280_9PEZI|nr:hypothetical protein CMUS01_14694 [Colletotrichum musicola]